MFSRKKDDEDQAAAPEPTAGLEPGPTRRAADERPVAPRVAAAPSVLPSARRSAVDIREGEQRRPAVSGDTKTLVVGRGIVLRGEIESCDKLMIEGQVEATVAGCREVEIAETGLLKSDAEIESAEIKGAFDGALTVRELLILRATGRVTGKIRVGKLEVERGGQIIGDVEIVAPAGPASAG